MAYKHVLQVDDETIFKVLKAAARFGGLVQVHAENGDVIEVTVRKRWPKATRRRSITR